MDLRAQLAPTFAARLAAIARDLMMQGAKCYSCGRLATPNVPDYADFRDAFDPQIKIKELEDRLDEARRCGNPARARTLNQELIKARAAVQPPKTK